MSDRGSSALRRSIVVTATAGLLAGGLAACGHSSSSGDCPLTGTAAPGGHAPARAALAVKVDNAPEARPPSGLNSADVVFEEPVEGGLTRFVAVFQCQGASKIGPVRSARLVDPDLLTPLNHVGLAHAGGIQPAIDKLASSDVVDVGDQRFPGAYHRDPNRSAPHNEYTSSEALWPQLPSNAPDALFTYSAKVPSGVPSAQLRIPFSSYSDVVWRYRPTDRQYERSYSSGPARDGSGAPITADDVVVQRVGLSDSGYVEDATGRHEQVVTVVGSGPATIFRDGVAIAGSWRRDSVSDRTTFVDAKGKKIRLRPGRTWIELVPDSVRTSP